jgi:hypothetical protein
LPCCSSEVRSLIQLICEKFILAGYLGVDQTRRYWELDRQGGCKNILKGLRANDYDN